MACNFPNRELGIITRSVTRFIDLTVGRAMGCFFGCLRVRDDRPRPHVLRLSESAEPAVSRNRISSLFVDEEKGDSRSPQISNDLKDEAKFLKACGTIPETPVEIRKASRKFKQSPPCGEDSEASEFHSWLPDASIDKFQLDQPPTPNKLFESPGRSSNSLENTPISCILSTVNTEMSTRCSSEGSEVITVDKTVKTGIITASAYGKNKSVRFECESDACYKSENNGQNVEELESLGYQNASRYSSPNPTPLKIYDEMQTPGTVFPFNVENMANGKTRIRSEYVHSVSNQDINASLLNAMKEEPFSSKEMIDELEDSPKRLEKDTTEMEIRVKQTSLVKDAEDVGNLSSWLKPKGPKQYTVDDSNKNILPMYTKTPGDRPIIGLVAAHWNDDESSRVSPKWWDGNGIPNSTTKYKEDQKVSWHATPFEERLEKALSDETRISQRKHVSQPRIYLDEADDSDTALSQLRPPSLSRSVVSV